MQTPHAAALGEKQVQSKEHAGKERSREVGKNPAAGLQGRDLNHKAGGALTLVSAAPAKAWRLEGLAELQEAEVVPASVLPRPGEGGVDAAQAASSAPGPGMHQAHSTE